MSETKQVGTSGSEGEFDAAAEESVELPPEATEEQAGTVDAETPAQEEIRLDVIFDILKNQRRRHVLRFLREHETTTLSDLAEHVAALENDKDIQSLTSSERKRVYVGLYQCHLPRMSDAGVIDFDSDRGRIELSEMADYLDPYLEVGDGSERPWPLYHLSIAVGGGTLYGLSALALGPQALLSVLLVPLVILAVAGSALVEYRATSSGDDERPR